MEIESLLKKQREFYNTRITDDVNYRIKKLKKLKETIYEFRSGSIEAVNVGHVLLEDSFRDRYACTADCIRDVMDMAYGNPLIGYMILD